MSHNLIPSSSSLPTRPVRFEVILPVAVAGVFLMVAAFAVAKRWVRPMFTESTTNDGSSVKPIKMSAPLNSITESRSQRTSDPMSGLAKIAFVREDTVYLYDVKTKAATRIAEGYYPDISPDGETLTFTVNVDDLNTTIKSFSLRTQTIRNVIPIQGLNARDARWSHNGRKLAFYVVVGRQGHIGVLDLATGKWDDITKSFPFRDHGGLPGLIVFNSWSPNDKSIIGHDLYSMFEIALDGRILNSIPFEKIIPGVEVTSALRFEFSSDRQLLLIDGSRNPEHSNIYAFNLQDHQLRRLTADIDGFESRWLPSQDAILFSRGKISDPDDTSDLCVMSLKDGKVTTILENAESGSYSTR